MKLFGYLSLAFVISLSVYSFGQPLAEGKPNGYAKFSELGHDLFYIAIILPKPSEDPRLIQALPNKKMELRVLAEGLSARRLSSLLINGAAVNNQPKSVKRNTPRLMKLLDGLRGDLAFGDTLVFQERGSKVELYVNSILVSEVRSKYVFNMLLSYWIGSVPPSREIKDRLLGREGSRSLAEAFHSTYYTSDRIHTVVRWFGNSASIKKRYLESKKNRRPQIPGNTPLPQAIVSFVDNPRERARDVSASD